MPRVRCRGLLNGALVGPGIGRTGSAWVQRQDLHLHSDSSLGLAVLARDIARYGRNGVQVVVWALTQMGCRHEVVVVALGGAAFVDALDRATL